MQALGQKYTGYKPKSSFQDTSIKPESGHDVLVDNFLNAQCKQYPLPSHSLRGG